MFWGDIMRKIFKLTLILLLMFSLTACFTPNSEETENISSDDVIVEIENNELWIINNYVDEFNKPTSKKFIANSKPLVGTFSNSATTDSKLEVMLLIEENDVAFKLFEYGSMELKNSYSNSVKYNVLIRPTAFANDDFIGTMYSNSDRILMEDFNALAVVWPMEKEEEYINIYIEEADTPLNSYLFEVPTENINLVLKELNWYQRPD